MSFIPALQKEIKELPPAYFTLVMSGGIVSLGAHLLKFTALADFFFWANNLAFAALLLLLLARLFFYPKALLTDFKMFKKGAGFLSLVAAASILGVQHVQQKQNYAVGGILFWCSLGLWVLLMYAFLMSVTTKADKPSLEKGISGVWLLMVVSAQAMALLGALLSKQLFLPQEQVLYLVLCLYSLGLMLYIILITLIFYRLTFFKAEPKEITPPYWVNEGAVGITALAGAIFMMNIPAASGVAAFLPFIKGVSLLAWATATWWIPFIVLLEVWKYGVKKVPLSYTPTYWALVFCIGGYAVATYQLAKVLNIGYLSALPGVVFWVALALLLLVLLGMCISIVKALQNNTSSSVK